MFYEKLKEFTGEISPFTPYADITDRAAWDALDEEWKKESIRLAESYQDYTFPGIPITYFMEFLRTGNRTHFENIQFEKRQALCALVLAECVENQGRFMDGILNGIYSICEESAWFLPAHNSYIRDTKQHPLPDSTDPVLELFSCETGAVLAAVYYLLKDKLDEISPFITKRIMHELKTRVFDPYFNHHFWWMGNGLEPMCNWTIWCIQNVLLSVFLTAPSDETFARAVLEKACKSIDYFLADYGEDGCCDEGAQYYRHAGLCLFLAMDTLNQVTNGAFEALYQNPKVQNIAAYIFNVHVQDKYFINFADCSPIAGRCGVREYLFAKYTGNQYMMDFAAQDFLAGGTETLLFPQEHNLYYRLQNAFTISEIRAHGANVPAVIPHADIFYPSVGMFLVRDSLYTLAVKAGDNNDSHNHNDTGSFTIYKNGLPLFIDIGVESYTAKTFSSHRYEIWTMQSAYHNLPTINGQMQPDGEAYHADVLSYTLEGDAPYMEMELAKAYPAEAKISSYKRKAALHRKEEIIIEDTFCFSDGSISSSDTDGEGSQNTVMLSFMTYERPMLQTRGPKSIDTDSEKDSLTLSIGDLGELTVSGGILHQIETYPITDPRLQGAWKHEIYRIQVLATNPSVKIYIK